MEPCERPIEGGSCGVFIVTDYSHKFATLDTNVVHAGRPSPHVEGAVVTPIFQSANYLMGDETDYGDVRYIRLSNSPNHRVLHARLAVLEHTEAALVTASGMAAITSTLLACLQSGETSVRRTSDSTSSSTAPRNI